MISISNINEDFSSNNIVLKVFYKVMEVVDKCVCVKSQGQFVLSLIWRADSLLTLCGQVKADKSRRGETG